MLVVAVVIVMLLGAAPTGSSRWLRRCCCFVVDSSSSCRRRLFDVIVDKKVQALFQKGIGDGTAGSEALLHPRKAVRLLEQFLKILLRPGQGIESLPHSKVPLVFRQHCCALLLLSLAR